MIKSILDAVSESVRTRMPETTTLPIFPLGSILFPGGGLSLRIFEQRYVEMAKACLKNSTPFGIALIRTGEEVGAPAEPHTVGTVARIVEWDMRDLGILQIRVRGENRFRLDSQSVTRSGLIVGEVMMIPDDPHVDCPELPLCAAFLRKVLTQTGSEHLTSAQFEDANWVSFRITEIMPFTRAVKQRMLELTDARMRLEILHRFLREQQLIA
jgi:Lon protease-like protein